MDLFDKKNIPSSPWFKFEKVGDKVGGIVEGMFNQPGRDGFADQKVFTLKTEDGSMVNVGIKTTSMYLMSRTANVTIGDQLGFQFVKEIPAKKKGMHPAKSIEAFVIKGEPVEASEE